MPDKPAPDPGAETQAKAVMPDPEMMVKVMLAEVEIIRAQAGLGPTIAVTQPMLRDLSPFGR
jgi:hypothetical protein